jgi:hypothetical protein
MGAATCDVPELSLDRCIPRSGVNGIDPGASHWVVVRSVTVARACRGLDAVVGTGTVSAVGGPVRCTSRPA